MMGFAPLNPSYACFARLRVRAFTFKCANDLQHKYRDIIRQLTNMYIEITCIIYMETLVGYRISTSFHSNTHGLESTLFQLFQLPRCTVNEVVSTAA